MDRRLHLLINASRQRAEGDLAAASRLDFLAPYAGPAGFAGVDVNVLLEYTGEHMRVFGDGAAGPIGAADAVGMGCVRRQLAQLGRRASALELPVLLARATNLPPALYAPDMFGALRRADERPQIAVDPALAVYARLCYEARLWHDAQRRPLNGLACYLTDKGLALGLRAGDAARRSSLSSPIACLSPRYQFSIMRLAVVLFALGAPELEHAHPIKALNVAERALSSEEPDERRYAQLLRQHYCLNIGVDAIASAEHLAAMLVAEVFPNAADLSRVLPGPLKLRPATLDVRHERGWCVHAPLYAAWLTYEPFGVTVAATFEPGVCALQPPADCDLADVAWALALGANSRPTDELIERALAALFHSAGHARVTAAVARRLVEGAAARDPSLAPLIRRRPRGSTIYAHMLDPSDVMGRMHYRALVRTAELLCARPAALMAYLMPGLPRRVTHAVRAAVRHPSIRAYLANPDHTHLHPSMLECYDGLLAALDAQTELGASACALCYSLVGIADGVGADVRMAIIDALMPEGWASTIELCPPLGEGSGPMRALLRFYSDDQSNPHVDAAVAELAAGRPSALVAITDTSDYLLPSAYCLLDALIMNDKWPRLTPTFAPDYPGLLELSGGEVITPRGSNWYDTIEQDFNTRFEPIGKVVTPRSSTWRDDALDFNAFFEPIDVHLRAPASPIDD